MKISQPSLRVAGLVAVVFFFPISTLASDSKLPTPAETRAEFEKICRALAASDDPYFGTAQVARLEKRLAELEAVGGEKDLPQRIDVRRQLAAEKLRLGANDQAIQLLGAALQQAAAAKLEVPLQLELLTQLGIAYLRFGEVRNCVDRHTPEMCIFPIGEGGRHQDPAGALEAVRAFRAVLAGAPNHPLVRWLLAVAAMTAGQYPEAVPPPLRLPPERLASAEPFPAFREVAHARGLHVFDTSGGAAVEDFDGDGWLDVVTSSIDPCAPLRFFRHRGHGAEAGGYEEAAAAAGLDGQLGGLNLVTADYDGDGDSDLLVLRGGWLGEHGRMRNSLLRNRGDGTFEDVTFAVGLAEPAYPSQTAAWADYDGDGDLDLFVGNEGPPGSAWPSQLFRSELAQGRHTFTEVAAEAGVTNLEGGDKEGGGSWAKGVAWGDYDGDGDPDLYVSNLGPNRLYRNEGDGTFTDVAPRLGVTEPAGRSFATWFFDYDNDGDLDLFVADYSASIEDMARHLTGQEVASGHPRLYRNDPAQADGERTFVDVSREVGLTAPALPMGSGFGDLDGDGFLDFYLGTGLPNYEALTPNLMYLNRPAEGGGRRFVDVSAAGRFGHLQKGHGVVFADVDNDGDQDVFEQMGGAFPGDAYASVLYENPGFGHPWLRLELVGTRSNRAAFGARVAVTVKTAQGSRTIYRTVGATGSFGSGPSRLEIGLGNAQTVEKVVVHWPAGGKQEVAGLELNRAHTLTESDLTETSPSEPKENGAAETAPSPN